MSKLTQKAIRSSFLKLLENKPIDHITIKDITEDCGISRNTFYYHYADLPTLVEEILMDTAEELIRDYPTIESVEECLDVGVQFVLSNRKAANHIYNSSHRYIYERCLMKVCRQVIASYFDLVVPQEYLSGEDRETMIEYYKCVSFGIVADWCDKGMKDDYAESFKKLLTLRSRMLGSEFGLGL